MKRNPPTWLLLAAITIVFTLPGLRPGALAQALPAAVQSQVDTLTAEKAARTAAQQKIDSQLLYAIKKQRGERIGAGLETFEKAIKLPADGSELLDLKAKVTPALIAHLEARGAKIIAAVPRFNGIRARVPLAEVEALAARADVLWIRKAVGAHTNVGTVDSEGDAAHRANLARQTLAASGRGVKVGVLSDSVDSLATSQGSLDLGPVTVLPGQSGLGAGNSGEGTAMLEIIHDLAPDAELFFASAFISEEQFAQNILDLRTAGCDIIVDDVGYFDESPFQDGPVAQAVNEVVASGALYFSSAGNEGNKAAGTSGTWEGDFVDGGPTAPLIAKAGRLHRFGANNFNTLTTNGAAATLFWADPAGASTNDYDLYTLDATGTVILAASTNFQNGQQDPYEIAGTVAGARLVIVKAPTAQPRFLHLGTLRGVLSESTGGAIVGHPAAAGALAVAATDAQAAVPPFTATNDVETFSTDGNRRVFFHADGTALTPGDFSATGGLLRQKPEITAADGVSTTVPGFATFFGTSAAAPHAAAIAALVWSRQRTLTPQAVRAALIGSAIDIEGAGVDPNSGAGIVDALTAVQAVPGGVIVTSTGPAFTGESFQPANTTFDPGETITVTLPLTNTGAIAAGNLVATLLDTGGVSQASVPQSYGPLAPGVGASRTFSFVVNDVAGSRVNLTFQVTDGAAYLGTVTGAFTVGTLGVERNLTNSTATTIPASGIASPYPSAITVTGFTGPVGRVRVTLTNFSHTYPSDVDIVLVSPSGRKMLLMADAGGTTAVTNVTLTFDDSAAGTLGAVLASGAFKPAPNGQEGTSLTTPAPVAPYGTTLGEFLGDTGNGVWSLYVRDQFPPDAGSIASWTLRLTPVSVLNSGPNPDLATTLTQSSGNLAVGEAVTYLAKVTNFGAAAAPNVTLTSTLPAQLAFGSAATTVGTVSAAGNVVTASLGTLASGQSATVTILATAVSPGQAITTVNVAPVAAETLVNNNTASAALTVGLPNLAATQIVVATSASPGVEAATISPTDPVFADLALANLGTSAARGFFISQLSVDGVLRRTFDRQLPLAVDAVDRETGVALGTFGPGIHTIVYQTDVLGVVPESSENDNTFTRTFTVAGPNLQPFQRGGASGEIVVSRVTGTSTDSPSINSADSVFVDYAIINSGALVTGVATSAQLFLDDVPVSLATVPDSLANGAVTEVTDFPLGPLAAGTHTLRLVVDSTAALVETNETDNQVVKTFVVNGVPVIKAIAPQSLAEDSVSRAISFDVGDEETAAGNLILSKFSSNPAVLPTDGIVFGGSGSNRTVTLTPAAHASGTSTLTITVDDGNGGTRSTSFLVTVLAVNDAPSFIGGPDLTVPEDAGLQTIARWAVALDRGGPEEAGQTLTFTTQADTPALFAVPPTVSAAGTLTFTPAAGASGSSTVTVQLRDDGGTADGGHDASTPLTFQITILAVNDAPGFIAGPDVSVAQGAGPQTITPWATGITAGSADESGQTLSFTTAVDQPALFSAPPAISPTGTLTFTPAAGTSGTATVTVRLQDTGGTAAGGSDASAPAVFRISITTFAEELGTYNGLALPAPGATPGADKTGLLKLTVSKKGGVSGRLTVGASRWSFRGSVDDSGAVKFGRSSTATLPLARRDLSSLTLTLHLDVGAGTDTLVGTLTDGAAPFATLSADRALYTNRRPIAPFRAVPAGLPGRYTLAFAALAAPNGGLTAEQYPQGDGFGVLFVNARGDAKIVATLADGTRVSYANALSKQNVWPLALSFRRGTGALAGPVPFQVAFPVAGESSFEAPALQWFRPAGSKLYPTGWPAGIAVDLEGSFYAPSSGAAILPGLGAADANGNARLTLLDGGITTPPGLLKALAISPSNDVSVLTAEADRVTLKLTTRTGLFKGSFTHPMSARKVKFQGAILRNQQLGTGFFTGPETVGRVSLEPNENP